MALRLIVTFKALPGKAQDFADAFKGLAAITLKEQGCEQYELFRSQQDADTLVCSSAGHRRRTSTRTWRRCKPAAVRPPQP
jgi:quinol monooxygenase YgiN